MSTSELACTYATLALFDDDVEITSEKIQSLLTAANVDVESYWPGLFAKLVVKESFSVADLLTGAVKGGGGGGAVAGGDAAGAGGGAAAKEEEKEEEEEEDKSSSASGPGLFGADSSSDDDSSD